METSVLRDPLLWKKKGAAFVTRTHRHLWGKNNEDPLVFLFRKGLSNEFVKSLHLGWNKHGQIRALESWGLERIKPGDPESLFLPSGIVFPNIMDKVLRGIWICSMENKNQITRVPGSQKEPIMLGNPENGVIAVSGLFEGLSLFQEGKQKICVKIEVPGEQ